MKKLLFALLLAYSPFAFCENWVCFDGRYAFKYCVDVESIKDDGAYRTAQVKMIVPEGAQIDEDNIYYMKFAASFDCNNKTTSWLSVELFDKDDKILEGRSKTNPNPAYDPIGNDGTSRFLYERVCGK